MQRSLLLAAPAVAVLVASGCRADRREPLESGLLEDLAPSEGFGYRMGPFTVPAGAETQDCYFVDVPDLDGTGAAVRIDRIEMAMDPGSHHFNVFRVNTILRLDGAPGEVVRGGECWDGANWSDWPLVANMQQSDPSDPYFAWTLPAGVAHVFHPGEKLMLQSHYVNATTVPWDRGIAVNFHRSTHPAPAELGTLFATQQSIRICRSDPNPTYSGSCSFPAGTFHFAAANGHFHSRGKTFGMFAWDGLTAATPPLEDRFYLSQSWDHPPMVVGLDVVPPSGGGVWWTCEYRWFEPDVGCQAIDELDPAGAGDCCYVFGPEVATGEHCNLFLYYWPKVATGDILCN